MPPKAAPGPSKKTEQKKKDKVVEDKTFGLKNKKGAKQQKFIQQVTKQVQTGGLPAARKADAAKVDDKKKVDDPLVNLLFKPVQKVEKGADPKSILCAFFKQGTCGKGDKCKFSHDLAIERKAEKRSLYCDAREEEQNETMDLWDDDKLKEVVEKKHGGSNVNKTDIICKYFLEAVEKSKYGWFWECPNGGSNCMYRHALPPGFMLKKDLKALQKENKENEISLEDWIENERHKLAGVTTLTKVTMETFVAWKKRKLAERKEELRKTEEKKLRDFKAGNKLGLSGRDMFTFNPELALDQEREEDEEVAMDYNNEGDDGDETEYKEVDLEQYTHFDIQNDLENLEIEEDLFCEDNL